MSARRTTVVVSGVLSVGVIAAAVTLMNLPDAPSGQNAAAALPAKSAEITKGTLLDQQSHDGTLSHGDTTQIGARSTGTVTALPATGATITRGKALYRVDNKPVILLYGTTPAYRTLASGVKGDDVRQFERNLWALGYRGFTVDDKFTASTAAAVKKWQHALGQSKTGTVDTTQIVYASGAVRVDSKAVAAGALVQPGADLMKITGTAPVAVVDLAMSDQRLARKGAQVEVQMPDGSTVKGRINDVETVVQQGQGDEPDTTLVEIQIGFSGTPQGLDKAAVTVDFTASKRDGVLSVPVEALLALAEGGYGVQVIENGAVHIVAVRTGLFADGRVEISASGLAAGMKVGMPT